MAEDSSQLLHDGRYQVTRVLGEGAQGSTLEARDNKSGRLVAVKRFVVRGAKQWKDVELAEREARVLASLSHPALPVYVDHFEQEGCLYLVMDKIEGESLATLRKRGVTFSRPDIVRFLREAGDVLDYLHGRAPPIIHRDIKPSNVIRRPDGSYCLVDFGSVRDTLKPEGGSTVVGTFGYMAPEQFQGRALPGSDVYAVGATALAMLTGVEPETLPHRGLALDVSAALADHADSALVGVLTRMLEPDPDKRPARLSPLVDELESSTAHPARDAWDAERWARDFSERYAGQAEHWARDFERQARQWARDFSDQYAESRHDWAGQGRRQRRHARRELRKARRRRRDEQRRAWQARRSWRGRRGYGPLSNPVFVAFVLLALAMARVFVWAMFDVGLPMVLTLLSVVFGKNFRRAAERLRVVGDRGREGLRRASFAIRDRADASAAHRYADRTRSTPTEAARPDVRAEPGVRVEPPRVRVGENEPDQDVEIEETTPRRGAARRDGP